MVPESLVQNIGKDCLIPCIGNFSASCDFCSARKGLTGVMAMVQPQSHHLVDFCTAQALALDAACLPASLFAGQFRV